MRRKILLSCFLAAEVCLLGTIHYKQVLEQEAKMAALEFSQLVAVQVTVDNDIIALDDEPVKVLPFYAKGQFLLLPLADTQDRKTQGFGQNLLAYGGMGLHGHPGVDWGTDVGTEVYAAHEGWVVEAYGDDVDETDSNEGFGNRVRIRWRDGNAGYEIIAGHLLSVSVKAGDYVRQGQVIGLSGNTGFSSRPHLHFGIRGIWCTSNAEYVDKSCQVTNMDNGYMGYFDPISYLINNK